MRETFQSRFGLIVALIGMAVGTGNIWRFPRVMAANGGGAFLIPWVLFLFLWSVPLLLTEFSFGKKLRRGVAGCFGELSGGKWTWMGGFVVMCTLSIMFYYSVVTGWCLFYFIQASSGPLFVEDSKELWTNFTSSSKPLYFHVTALLLTLLVIGRGVRKGIEATSRVMIPALFLILVGLAVYAMTLPGRTQGLGFVFGTDFSKLTEYQVWLEALSQSAWSTGAGWGIALTYGCYANSTDRPTLTSFTTGLGNNSIELIVAFSIFPALFSFFPWPEILEMTKSGNTGLTFIALPGLFQQMPGGRIVGILFFMALFFAAFTSLFSMFELGISFLKDIGFKRTKATILLLIVAIAIGTPSALDMKFFDNQDWVWGVGLLVSGFFFSCLARKVGMKRFQEDFVPLKGLGATLYKIIVHWLIPIEFIALLLWWFSQAMTWDPEGWWKPFSTFGVGSCLFQWGILLVALVILNKWMNQRMEKASHE